MVWEELGPESVAGMVIAGFVTLLVQKVLWGIATKRDGRTSPG
ncbi:MAG TPA: hypothetical protein VGP70_24870 [Actinomadura sp.]|nr:hypothetical protein [Actinomadura sp.]